MTVTDPKGDYKRYYSDAFGNLVWAVDPKPGGGEYGTGYKYDLLNRLREVIMYRDGVTQIRKFEYNAQQRLETVTTPESGTTSYEYNPNGTLLRKTWANGGKVEYGYDTWKRVNAINRFMPGSSSADVCQSVTLGYDVVWNLDQGGTPAPLNRLVTRTWGNSNPAVCPGGRITERLVYNKAGQVMAKQMSVNLNGVERHLTAYWQYDKDRTVQEDYPNPWESSKDAYHPEFGFGWGYDEMNRLERMSWFGRAPGSGHPQVRQWVANTAVYDAAGQMTHLTIVGKNEWRTYNHLGQLTGISTDMVGPNSVSLIYQYRATTNDGRVDSMIDQSLINGVAVNEMVSYGYDSLKRLKTASTMGPQWGLDFGYDAFGNLWSQTVTKGSGPQFSLNGNSARTVWRTISTTRTGM